MRLSHGVGEIICSTISVRHRLTSALLLLGVFPGIAFLLGCKKPSSPKAAVATLQPVPQVAQTNVSNSDEQSCRTFVQAFYDWYVANDDKDRFTASLRPRRSAFEPKLWNMLVAENEAQSHADEIVGLDFDPILASQDPSSKFRVESVSSNEGHCETVVRGVEQGTKRERVTPELRIVHGNWIFVDFHYQFETQGKLSESNLVQILKDLKEQRVRDPQEKPK